MIIAVLMAPDRARYLAYDLRTDEAAGVLVVAANRACVGAIGRSDPRAMHFVDPPPIGRYPSATLRALRWLENRTAEQGHRALRFVRSLEWRLRTLDRLARLGAVGRRSWQIRHRRSRLRRILRSLVRGCLVSEIWLYDLAFIDVVSEVAADLETRVVIR